MAHELMTEQTQDHLDAGGLSGYKFHNSQVLAAPGNSPWIIYPRGASAVTLFMTPTGGKAKVQATICKRSDIQNDTVPAESIVDWPAGESNKFEQETVSFVMAFRLVNVDATSVTLLSMASR